MVNRVEVMTIVKEFWLNNMAPKVDQLDTQLSDEEILNICRDLVKITKNIGIFTASLSENISCSVIPEMSVFNPDSEVTIWYNKFVNMIRRLMYLCGTEMPHTSIIEGYDITDKTQTIFSMKSIKEKLFSDTDGFNKWLLECAELDKS